MLDLRNLALATILALATLLPTSALQAQDDARSCLAAARKSLASARGLEDEDKKAVLDEALTLFQAVGERWPDAVEERANALLEAAALLQKLARPDEARASLLAVLDLPAPGKLKARALAAAAALERRRKEPEAATALLERLIREFPDEEKEVAEARLDLGAQARDQKRWASALRLADEVIEAHPGLWRQNLEACQLRLGVLLRCRQWQQATAELERLDALMARRFKDGKHWESVARGLAALSARKSLTPLPVIDP
ncbi:MAG: tetratricopeptide repeat protein [Planctomycetes bacterium]|nr:tetratricopeptide repeat protein [Planctomycetota bacterium]